MCEASQGAEEHVALWRHGSAPAWKTFLSLWNLEYLSFLAILFWS